MCYENYKSEQNERPSDYYEIFCAYFWLIKFKMSWSDDLFDKRSNCVEKDVPN